MALTGSLRDFGLADILQLIYFQKKTGILTLSSQSDMVRLLFYEGNVISAESRKRLEEERLGKILLKKGLIGEADLKSCLEEQKIAGAKIGDILLKRGLVAKEDIEETLISQMTETVVQLFSWKEGIYEFQSQEVTVSRDMTINLDTQHLLMNGLRIIDEWSLVEGKITLDTVFRRTEMSGVVVTREEEGILKFVDGENDVSIIIDLSGLNDFEVSRTLVSLMERGIIETVEVPPVITEMVTAPRAEGEKFFVRFLPPVIFLIAFVVSLMAVTLQVRGTQKGIRILWSGELISRLKAVNDIDELRFMAEVYKYKNGSYPQKLQQIGSAKDPWGRTYVYSVENDNLIILSAGPDGKVGTADDVY